MWKWGESAPCDQARLWQPHGPRYAKSHAVWQSSSLSTEKLGPPEWRPFWSPKAHLGHMGPIHHKSTCTQENRRTFNNKGFPSNPSWTGCRWSPQGRWTPPGHPHDTPPARCCRLPICPVHVVRCMLHGACRTVYADSAHRTVHAVRSMLHGACRTVHAVRPGACRMVHALQSMPNATVGASWPM